MEKKKTKRVSRKRTITDEEYITYIGEHSLIYLDKFKKVQNKDITFNFAAGFLGIFYFLYRKMYLTALLYLLLSMLLPDNIITAVFLFLLAGFASDYIYYNKATYEIKATKETKFSNEMKKELMRQYGGTSMFGPCIILFSIVFLLTILILGTISLGYMPLM